MHDFASFVQSLSNPIKSDKSLTQHPNPDVTGPLCDFNMSTGEKDLVVTPDSYWIKAPSKEFLVCERIGLNLTKPVFPKERF